ncbi:MAG: phosphoenolpyruvate--protein phosphotransferase [Formivibrio sp.]|nr:phosphoenolpyruvate--protein phosphotransferase [Formivibrio sp.]
MFATVPQMDIRAPLSGVVVPLDSIPDPVFAQKMVGDGVSIDPTSNEVLAPVAGTVTQLHHAHHALAITADNGVEVLIHIGLDTVLLKGQGFTPLVAQGDRVECGQAVLRFDVEYVASHARSLLTEVIITSGDKVAFMKPASGLVEAGKSVLLHLELIDGVSSVATATAGDAVFSNKVSLPNPVGLHARPAAILATEAKKYTSDIRLLRGADEVNAKSVVAIMGLSTTQGELVQIKATGADAQKAAAELARLLADGCGEKPGDAPDTPVESVKAEPVARPVASVPGELSGAAASPGLAVGRVIQFRHDAIDVQEIGDSQPQEKAKFDAALREAAVQIDELKKKIADPSKAQILDAHLALLDDPDLIELAQAALAQGKSAAFAWQSAFTSNAAKLEKLENALLRERANDIRDVGRRVLSLLAGVKQAQIVVPDGSILIAEELTPSDTASFDRSKLLGFCTTTGGSTSHVAILARSMGIPAVCGIDEAALALADGTQVVIDGSLGTLRVEPDAAYLVQTQERIVRLAAKREEEKAAAFNQAKTSDGHRVEVVANIRNAADAREAVAAGAEGVGLLRSEFLFDERDSAPSEDEQAEAYMAVAEALGKDRPFVVRTLDVGGDKPLSYLPLPKEDNPFLGMRGIRVSLDHPEMFRTQLRAILRAAPLGNVHIMFPMISGLDEVRAAKAILAEEQKNFKHSVKVGVMIEVPSAAAIAEVLAREVDFFSIGTNDLTQYTLAMDRGHPKLAKHADALHPAVLRMIAMTVEGAHKHGKWVGVCGGIASDSLAVPVLVGLGVDELSVDVPSIAAVKATLSRLTFEECKSLAGEVLKYGTSAEVRALLVPHVE